MGVLFRGRAKPSYRAQIVKNIWIQPVSHHRTFSTTILSEARTLFHSSMMPSTVSDSVEKETLQHGRYNGHALYPAMQIQSSSISNKRTCRFYGTREPHAASKQTGGRGQSGTAAPADQRRWPSSRGEAGQSRVRLSSPPGTTSLAWAQWPNQGPEKWWRRRQLLCWGPL